ncbi:4Fe-4S binding protein [Clostridium cadaveris]|uniref:[Fe-Fe] hydrogenase large subunit C-terminal domain-containing protein n=1 Tax=Clostridium cadaveris TaxID=1529 RepID=UPI0014593B2C|nr:[Fe-Fe] hydrogenase large subunit C-terminal domain-containing protein [Clostridium cadaveris]NME65984.1 4Fe-4S binding protein [Clostridium cadaveris]UFH64478.1 4Fe-4S binding protein [Clostridium cadaveris]
MGIIKFLETNCRNCYACVRACEVNAIKIKNDQAQIIEDRCIHCGMCVSACPRNAKDIECDIDKVKGFFKNNERTVVSLGSTFVGAFGHNSPKIVAALKKLGFDYVEEIVIASQRVSREYEKYAERKDGKCYITSYCPSINELIQKYYPEVIPNLIPVIPPMVCHGKMIKKRYGDDTRVIFIGPCVAKKSEAKGEDDVDAIITFDELSLWLKEEGIEFSSLEEVPFDDKSIYGKRFPIFGETVYQMNTRGLKGEVIYVDGINDCKEVLQKVREGKFKDILIEMNLCRHGCLDGPAMPHNVATIYERQQDMKKYINNCEKTNKSYLKMEPEDNIDMVKKFDPKVQTLKRPSKEEITAILASIGKYRREDELNCGACGYSTCRQKAIAVYNGLAEPTMCLPFMKQKAENFSNIIFDMTPTVILVIDDKLKVLDCNSAAEKFFSTTKGAAIGSSIGKFMHTSIIKESISSDRDIINRRQNLDANNATVLTSIIKVENSNIILVLINDFTKALKQEEKLQKMRINAIDMAQHVIDKQMTVAQEIASLLGETTAETKVSLTKLKRLVQGEEVDLK